MDVMEKEVSQGNIGNYVIVAICYPRIYQDKAMAVTVEYLCVNMLAISVNIAVAIITDFHFLKNKCAA